MSEISILDFVNQESDENVPSVRGFFIVAFENQGRYQSTLKRHPSCCGEAQGFDVAVLSTNHSANFSLYRSALFKKDLMQNTDLLWHPYFK